MFILYLTGKKVLSLDTQNNEILFENKSQNINRLRVKNDMITQRQNARL